MPSDLEMFRHAHGGRYVLAKDGQGIVRANPASPEHFGERVLRGTQGKKWYGSAANETENVKIKARFTGELTSEIGKKGAQAVCRNAGLPDGWDATIKPLSGKKISKVFSHYDKYVECIGITNLAVANYLNPNLDNSVYLSAKEKRSVFARLLIDYIQKTPNTFLKAGDANCQVLLGLFHDMVKQHPMYGVRSLFQSDVAVIGKGAIDAYSKSRDADCQRVKLLKAACPQLPSELVLGIGAIINNLLPHWPAEVVSVR